MTMTMRLLSGVAAFTLVGAAFAAGAFDDDVLPRYQFRPGQELTFRSSSSFKYGQGDNAGSLDSRSDWTVWVLRANPDGSFRLAVREKSSMSQTMSKQKNDQPAQSRLVYADVFPDGRVVPNKTIQYRSHPGAIFPPLPKDAAEAKVGWESSRDGERTVAKPVATAGGFAFETVSESPMNAIYLITNKVKYSFDPARGFMTKAETANTQGYGFNGSGTGTVELLDVKSLAPDALRQFAAAADRYFAAVADYEAKTEAVSKAKPDDAKALLAKAVEGLKAAAADMKQEELVAELNERIKQHEQMAKYTLDDAERRAKVMGQPAAEFETTDLNGKKVKLADLRGQVVVLDFWYRGCGWCVKAMPQMNELAADFAGQPVAIFGMNTDRDEADARFVIEKMALKYPNLKAEGLPQKFGVQGFPTLIIVDQQGRVHDIHVGYSPTLRDDVGKVIRELLAKK